MSRSSLAIVVTLAAGHAEAMALAPGAKVLISGNGPIQILAARLSAICGFETTLACLAETQERDMKMLFDDRYPEGSLPLTIMPITGDAVDTDLIEKTCLEAEGLIIAFDNERTLPEGAMNVFMPEGSKLSHVSVMSRYLNGKGMMFTCNAAKVAANPDIWAGGNMINEYKQFEANVASRAKALGASKTVIRAGTLKGGGNAFDADSGGEPMFLNSYFYSLGQQDIVNWRLLYDCSALAVDLAAGDDMAGPGFTAALTATDRCGPGDSHRGAVAMALVQSLASDAAKDKDFSVAAKEGREFPQPSEWGAMFANAK